MRNELMQLREQHIEILDNFSKELAEEIKKGKLITEKMIQAIVNLYDTANIEKKINEKNGFSSAYHSPVTSDFEFIFARLIYHIGIIFNKGWKVDLRRQINKTTPDIRISKNDKTLWILELKVSLGWIRSFICPTFYKKSIERKNSRNKWDPDIFNKEQARQLEKYSESYSISKNRIYYVVPSLASIHYRKDSKDLVIDDYRNHFKKVSGLSAENLVIFNENLIQRLNIPRETSQNFSPTKDLENMIKFFVNEGEKKNLI